MENRYDPTIRENVSEIGNMTKAYFNKEGLREKAYDFKGAFLTNFHPFFMHALHTTSRKSEDIAKDYKGIRSPIPEKYRIQEAKRNKGIQHLGEFFGLTTSSILQLVQTLPYYYTIKEGHPEALAIPILTNIASDLYEKARENNVNKNKPLEKNLENEK